MKIDFRAVSLTSLARNLDLFTVFEGVKDYGDIGRHFVNNSSGYSVPQVLENFIDYENLGRHIAEEHGGKFVSGAFVCMKEGHTLDEVISEESQNIINQQNDENEVMLNCEYIICILKRIRMKAIC